MKNRFKKGPSPAAKRPGGFPPAPPGIASQRARPRMMLPHRTPVRTPVRRPATKTDKELEDTLKKLKDMGK